MCAHIVPLRRGRLSQLCTNSPPGSSGLSHLLSACWASSNLAASDGETGALGVSSPQDCQKSSVKSPYRLALQAPRKLTRRRDWGGGDTGRNFFLFMLQQYYSFTKDFLCDPCQWSFYLGECEGQLRSIKNELDFSVWLVGDWPAVLFTFQSYFLVHFPQSNSTWTVHDSFCTNIWTFKSGKKLTFFANGPQHLPDFQIHKQCLTFWIK